MLSASVWDPVNSWRDIKATAWRDSPQHWLVSLGKPLQECPSTARWHTARFTVVRNLKDELKKGTLHAMLRQLALTLDDLYE